MSEPSPVIPLAEPSLEGNTKRYIDECLATNFVSSVGPFVDRFEREFAEFVGAKYAVACASGTAAIHVALRLLGVEQDDEIFVSTLTFIASANPIFYEKARPVLVDAEHSTWNMNPDLVVEELERRARAGERQPRAVELVHILGQPARLGALLETCDKYGVTLFEDAAEALGARYVTGPHAGKHVGTVGKIGCFSFNGNKVITTGGGGMITTDDEKLARRAKHLTTQARLPGAEYRHDEVGYNYRLTNLAAALGCAQLEVLPSFLERKKAIADRYDTALGARFGLPPRTDFAAPSHWLYSVLVDERAKTDRVTLHEKLLAKNIHTRPIWSPLHTMPMYAKARCLGHEVADLLHATGLSLPCSVTLTQAQQDVVIRELLRA